MVYRGSKICKPDARGYIRPQVADKRFTVGNVRDISEGEARRRVDALKELFDRQSAYFETDKWTDWLLPYAEQIARGQQLTFNVSDYARQNVGQAAEEADGLQRFKDIGLPFTADDPVTIRNGERQIQQWINDRVKLAVEKALHESTGHLPIGLKEKLATDLPDPANAETRTFHDALKAYRKHKQKTGKKMDNGNLAPSARNYIRWSKQLGNSHDDIPLWQFTKTELEEWVAYWRNRPESTHTGKRIGKAHAEHMLSCLWAVLTWVDDSDWKWEFPKGATRIDRTPIRLDSDRAKKRARRISGNTYNPQQLAIIAGELDTLGKLILGLSVNCAMQPAEVGRVEIDDFCNPHCETGEPGNWLIFDRPKTFEYGEWFLWPEVNNLVLWGIKRARKTDSDRLIVSDGGKVWYNENWTNPETRFAKWWQAKPTKNSRHIGVVTKLQRDRDDFPRFTIKTLRKIVPNLVRPNWGREVADLVNARKVSDEGLIAGSETDRYADRPYDAVADALRHLEGEFRPFLDALKIAESVKGME